MVRKHLYILLLNSVVNSLYIVVIVSVVLLLFLSPQLSDLITSAMTPGKQSERK